MKREFDFLAQTIHNLSKGETVVYVANGGNWGDGLIREATLLFFKDYGISYHEIPFHDRTWRSHISNDFLMNFFKDKILIFGGGGAWCDIFYSGAYFVNYISAFFKEVLVLPSTLMNQIEAKNVIYFRRDKFQSKIYYPESIFCHDMAFYMNGLLTAPNPLKKDGYFFRCDQESAKRVNIPDNNIDISSFGNEFSPITPFISNIWDYETIHTDRLHVAILACLASRKTHFHTGGYFKNEAVYKSSMEGFHNHAFFYK